MKRDLLIRRLRPVLDAALEQGIFTRGVLGFLDEDGDSWVHAVSRDPGFSAEAVFDLASLTKCVPTSTLALMRLIDGRLRLNDPVVRWIPELRMRHRDVITVEHLLTHTLDYRVPMSSLKEKSPEEILEFLMSYEFLEPPGSVFNYGNPASILLGLLLERLDGMPLDALGSRDVFDPLSMRDTGWNPLSRVTRARVVPTENCPWRGRVLQGEVHDESAFRLGRPVGSAGVFGTAGDLLRLMRFYLFESPELLRLVTYNAIAHIPGQSAALGWELCNPRFMGKNAGKRCFGKTGFTGMSIVADVDRKNAVVWLCDFTWPRREPSVERIYELRRAIHDTVWS